MHKERVRIMGIDTPESRTKDLVEKSYGLRAKEFMKYLMPIGSMQIIKTQKDKTGKFGRILGDFIIEHKDDNNNYSSKLASVLMMENYHAVPYKGQNKDDLIELHMANRVMLEQLL
jgi:micrococcal nuclease|tara:strand:- start:1594 stop:1941 length:348 start_codon:yes stop_codon:yes gene_type:complete